MKPVTPVMVRLDRLAQRGFAPAAAQGAAGEVSGRAEHGERDEDGEADESDAGGHLEDAQGVVGGVAGAPRAARGNGLLAGVAGDLDLDGRVVRATADRVELRLQAVELAAVVCDAGLQARDLLRGRRLA